MKSNVNLKNLEKMWCEAYDRADFRELDKVAINAILELDRSSGLLDKTHEQNVKIVGG